MKRESKTTETDVEFIRLFFHSPQEEAVAVRIASLVASAVGERIAQLRPETRLSEIIQWTDSLDSVGVVMALEEIFGHEIPDEMADDFEHQGFRELVEYASQTTCAA